MFITIMIALGMLVMFVLCSLLMYDHYSSDSYGLAIIFLILSLTYAYVFVDVIKGMIPQ